MKLPAPARRPCARARAPGTRQRQRRAATAATAPPPPKPTVKDAAVEGTATVVGWLDERTGA